MEKGLKIIISIVAVAAIAGGSIYAFSHKKTDIPASALIATGTTTETIPIAQADILDQTSGAPKTVIDSSLPSQNVPILVYHNILPTPSFKESATALQYRITPEVFAAQMKYLSDHDYNTVTFATLLKDLKGGIALPEKSVVLTFDDGWKNQYENAVPVLEKYNFNATFFIISKSTTGGYMTWDNLKELVGKGFDIESHTETHAMLTKITPEQLKEELVGSKKMLEDKLGIPVTTIAYPYYAQNETVRAAVESAGYIGARAGWASFKNSANHIYQLVSQEAVSNPNPFSDKRLPDSETENL